MKSFKICYYCTHKNDASVCCDRCYNHNYFDGVEIEPPLKHGEWVFSEDGSKRVCSNCRVEAHWTVTRDTQILSLYCPNCGSKNGVS